jgi:hypothetical protein
MSRPCLRTAGVRIKHRRRVHDRLPDSRLLNVLPHHVTANLVRCRLNALSHASFSLPCMVHRVLHFAPPATGFLFSNSQRQMSGMQLCAGTWVCRCLARSFPLPRRLRFHDFALTPRTGHKTQWQALLKPPVCRRRPRTVLVCGQVSGFRGERTLKKTCPDALWRSHPRLHTT